MGLAAIAAYSAVKGIDDSMSGDAYRKENGKQVTAQSSNDLANMYTRSMLMSSGSDQQAEQASRDGVLSTMAQTAKSVMSKGLSK